MGTFSDSSANVLEAFFHLVCKPSVDGVQNVPKKVFDVSVGHTFFSQISGKENRKQVIKNLDNHLLRRQILPCKMIHTSDCPVVFNNFIHKFGQAFLRPFLLHFFTVL